MDRSGEPDIWRNAQVGALPDPAGELAEVVIRGGDPVPVRTTANP